MPHPAPSGEFRRRHRHHYQQPAGRDELNRLQKSITNYLRDNAHPATGLAYEASFAFSGQAGRPLAVGGNGFGIAALVAGIERGWLDRVEVAQRIVRMGTFLRDGVDRKALHGAFPRWLYADNGRSGADSADLMETAFLMQGLLIARAYFNADSATERELRAIVDTLWREVEWDWFTDGKDQGLHWQWSRENGFRNSGKMHSSQESLVAYVLALGSPTHPIAASSYQHWQDSGDQAEHSVAGYRLAAPGPLAQCHYSFVGLNPWELADRQTPEGYFLKNARQVLANRGYCLYEAPEDFQYGEGLWGLSSCLTPDGYELFAPEHDRGYVAPTAALASLPYAPYYAMQVLANLNGNLRRMAWGENGPYDAVNLADNWCAREYLALNQLPIAGMIENYRSGLLWDLFMSVPEVQAGLVKAGLRRPALAAGFPEALRTLEQAEGGGYAEGNFVTVTHPDRNVFLIPYWADQKGAAEFVLYDGDGGAIWRSSPQAAAGRNWLEILPGDIDWGLDVASGDSGLPPPDAELGLVLRLRLENQDYRLPIELRHMP